MRRYVFLSVPVLAFGLMACEDGPNQTYSPATGTLFNSGDTLAVTDDASAPLDAMYGGSSKQQICGGAELQSQWSKMVQMPLAPPRFQAGLDLAGGDQFPGLTIQQATSGPLPLLASASLPPNVKAANAPSRLCQYTVEGVGGDSSDVGGSLQVHWGNNSEVQMEYATPTQKAYVLYLNQGYSGHMKWTYTPPTNADGSPNTQAYDYDFALSQQITKTKHGQPVSPTDVIVFDWSSSASFHPAVDELYRGLVSNFAPDLYNSGPADCFTSATCAAGDPQDGTGRILLRFRPISFYMFTFPNASSKLGSTFQSTYTFNVKYAPYSVSYSYQTLLQCPYADPNYPGKTTPCPFDQANTGPLYGSATDTVPNFPALQTNSGPISYVTSIGDEGKNCVLKLGDTYGNLRQNCIEVYKDTATGDTALAKVLGNLSHDDQNFTFSVVGINQNYRPASFEIGQPNQFKVIPDTLVPADADTAGNFQSDIRTYGPVENESYPVRNLATHAVTWASDYHASGAVYKEFQKLVQTQLAADWVAQFGAKAGDGGAPATPRTLHDPACVMGAMDDVNTWRPAAGCTGFEGMITGGPSDGATDMYNLDFFADKTKQTAAYKAFAGTYGGALGAFGETIKAGDPQIAFCNDPGTYQYCGLNTPGDIYGLFGSIFSASLQRATQFLGNGDINKVPLEGRDLRFYFRYFTIAMNKYLQSGESLKRGHNVNCTRPDAASAVTCSVDEGLNSANIDNTKLDSDYLIFDSYGGGASRSEYVYSANADLNNDPIDYEMKFLILSANFQSSNFYKRLDREERGLFDSLALDSTQASWGYFKKNGKAVTNDNGFPIPNASVLLTNIFGSPVLSSIGYSEADDAMGNIIAAPTGYVNPCAPGLAVAGKDAYYCATHADSDCPIQGPLAADGVTLLTRDNGKPLLDGYCGVFSPTVFALGTVSPMTINSVQPFQQTAIVGMPILANPYDAADAPASLTPCKDGAIAPPCALQVLVPWKPNQEGVGYPVAADGQHDVFVQTAQLDFTGQVVTPVLDYNTCNIKIGDTTGTCLPASDTTTPATAHVSVQAVETEDFLGDVFLCQDATTAVKNASIPAPGDLLYAHMYTSVQTILDWITSHPGSIDNCGLIIRYSPYNNYPDFIQSSTNGVRLNIEQGSGLGRVSDVTLFVPGTGAPANQ